MIFKDISDKLQKQGYTKAISDTNIADFYFRVNYDNTMDICGVIKNINGIRVTEEQIIGMAQQMERKFLLNGHGDVRLMNIIVSYSEQPVSKLENSGINFWVLDLSSNRLMVYENQPTDYEGLREVIENGLYDAGYEHEETTVKKKSFMEKPFINYGILALNVVMFILCEFLGGTDDIRLMLKMGALNYNLVMADLQFYRLVTSMFLHFGEGHLINNMFFLVLAGNRVEEWMGHLNYFMLYFVSGVGAGVTSVVYHMYMNDSVISAGASGAIYGIFGALIIMMFVTRRIEADTMAFVIMLLIFGGMEKNIDVAAHIGGFVVGIILTIGLVIVNGGHRNKDTQYHE